MIESYRDLKVWQKAVNLVVNCYQVSEGFPAHEKYGLSSQLRRAAVSIPANIAEGKHRHHLKEFKHHLTFSYGSLAELETHCILAQRLGYISESDLEKILHNASEIGKMLNGLITSLKSKL